MSWSRVVLSCFCLASATPALAGVPAPWPDSDVPGNLRLVSILGGQADAAGEFSIVVRNYAHVPEPGSAVTIDLSGCLPDLRVCSVQTVEGVVAECHGTGSLIHAVTNGEGRVTLRIVGAADNRGRTGVPLPLSCAVVYADGVVLRNVGISAYDQNGVGGVTPADLSLLLGDALDSVYRGRSDLSGNGKVDPTDISLLLRVMIGAPRTSCGSYCD